MKLSIKAKSSPKPPSQNTNHLIVVLQPLLTLVIRWNQTGQHQSMYLAAVNESNFYYKNKMEKTVSQCRTWPRCDGLRDKRRSFWKRDSCQVSSPPI